MWKKIKNGWNVFWIGDEYDNSKKHLSQSDKRFFLYGNFIISSSTIAMVFLIIGINNLWISHKNDADMEEITNIIVSYIESATENEYDEIVQTIRHDLILSGDYDEDIEKYIRYIPNTSERCHVCEECYSARAVLVSLNTGESYSLDLVECGMTSDDYQGSMRLMFGYDEISQTNIRILKNPEEKEEIIEITHGNGIVSIHKMKKLFCDECIAAILKTIKKQRLGEFILFDTVENVFYPVEDKSDVKIGDYILKIEYKDGGYEIKNEMVE